METLKELVAPKTINSISYGAVIFWIASGIILSGIFLDIEINESRFDFRCAAESERIDLVRGQCFEQYEKQYNKSGVPVFGFVILNFSLVVLVGGIYSRVVKSRVNKLLAGNRGRPPERKRRLIVAYLCQLVTRSAMGIVFIVLQTQVLYPANFPSDFLCQIAGGSHAANASSTDSIQNTTICHNQRATKKTSWMHAVTVVNGAFVLLILIEIICILSRARKGKKFLEDSQFLADHLPPREEQDSQESEDHELQQVPSLSAFIESLKKSIIVNTERPKDLEALFQKKHGETTRNEDLTIDGIYTNLILITNTAKYDFSGGREEQLKVYPSFSANQPVCSNSEQPMPLSALFYNLVKGHLLDGATVLTTTRPTTVSDVTGFAFCRTFEILGFAFEQVKEYVSNFTKNAAKNDTGEKIWQHISTNMNIFTLCYIPVNLFIVCSCLLEVLNFENLSTGVGLPTKLTQIYQIATKLFFFRHNKQYRDKRLSRENIESKDWPPEFKPLAKIAFNGIRERKRIFTSNEVSEDVVQSELFHRLPDRQTAPFKHEAQLCFIHLTVQEFLAAKHIVDTMKEEELRRFVAEHINEGEWQMVMQFLAGLLGDGDKPSIDIFTELLPKTTYERHESRRMDNEEQDDSVEPRKVTCWPTRSEQHLAVTLIKCIYENNESGSVVQSKLEEIGFNAVDFSLCRLAPADCTAVVHVLKSCQKISLINLFYNNIGSLGCVEIIKLFDNSNCKLSSLNLRYNNITVEGVQQLSNALVNNNCKLSSLNLSRNNITDEGVKQLSNALVNNNCKLSTLNLSYNNITVEGVKQLSNALENNNKLRSLNLTFNIRITSEALIKTQKANPNCNVIF